jgi:hypothetical protein
MSATKVNDKFLELMSAEEPLLYNKFMGTQFFVAEGNVNGVNEIKLFYTTNLFDEVEHKKIGFLFKEALKISS